MESAPHQDGFSVESNGRGLVCVFSASTLSVELVLSAAEGLLDAGVNSSTPFLVFDALRVESFETDLDRIHRMAVGIQMRLQLGPEARTPLVVSPGAGEEFGAAFEGVRSVLTPSLPESRPSYRVFTSLDAAVEWAAS